MNHLSKICNGKCNKEKELKEFASCKIFLKRKQEYKKVYFSTCKKCIQEKRNERYRLDEEYRKKRIFTTKKSKINRNKCI
jgi:hypothetical protein